MVSIYKLIDPRNHSVRYIGKTVSPIRDRLKVHVYQSKRAKKPTHKEAWIKQLVSQNLIPIIETVDTVSIDEWKHAEIEAIQKHKDAGHDLTNMAEGGHGHNGVKMSEEMKEYMRTLMTGNTHAKGTKWTPEQREKMKKRKTWNKGMKGVMTMSDETKAKMGESSKEAWKTRVRKHRVVSDETKKKLSEAAKKDWEKRKSK